MAEEGSRCRLRQSTWRCGSLTHGREACSGSAGGKRDISRGLAVVALGGQGSGNEGAELR
jgi:hypothetical protein